MIIERVTVTTIPTSIKNLIDAARPESDVPKKCSEITFKYNAAETDIVQISDADTTTKVTILDNVTEKIRACSFENFGIDLVLLSSVTGDIDIDIVISQRLV